MKHLLINYCLFFIYFILGSCKTNVFQRWSPAAAEDQILKSLATEDYTTAFELSNHLIKPENLTLLLNPETSEEKILQIIKQDFFGTDDDTLDLYSSHLNNNKRALALFLISFLRVAGINPMQAAISLTKANQSDANNSSENDMIIAFMKSIPQGNLAIAALKTYVAASKLEPLDKKHSANIMNDIIDILFYFIASVKILNDDDDGTSPSTIASLDQNYLDHLYSLILYAQKLSDTLVAKDANPVNKIIQTSILTIISQLDKINGSPAFKMRAFLYHILITERPNLNDKPHRVSPTDPIISAKPNQHVANLLLTKFKKYMQMVKPDEKGWLTDTKCDGLLFNSLYSVAGGKAAILAARNEDGQWFRNHMKNCYINKEAASTISQDMLTGLLWWIYAHKELKVLEELIAYGLAHQSGDGRWIMGEGPSTRTYMGKNLIRLAYMLKDHLTTGKLVPLPSEIILWEPFNYGGHLQTLQLYLRAQLRGGITQEELHVLEIMAKRNPKNALYNMIYRRYTDGDMTEVSKILLDESIFPSDRLPTSSDQRCSLYLWHHEQKIGKELAPEYQPCTDSKLKEYSGIDFIIATYWLINSP